MLSVQTKQRQHEIIMTVLKRLLDGDALPKQIAVILWDESFTFWAEETLDELWDMGLCICLGTFHNFAYRITKKGIQYFNTNGEQP